ncbi:hypothetical protein [Streptomyces sp. NBC_01320]|uniref:hypothetical protein n=1 Tax=Streptomyces sp. NBC_01320 TaxID=2903824 RepID=UPI002E100C28|nr:hypothetical protein OG395_01805 [Streptomyces sp. NBC_01320]WSK00701.1 hypothetical protein OG395_51925 [Streptomyces sp. NBC_01320]WSK00946.1 hypothetical protein OG395_53535 [Streptomyces sp. NBC_01320]
MELARRYEDLRAAVLGGPDAGSRHGWAVLARSGMAAWLLAVALVPAAALPARRASPPAVDRGPEAEELVQVLAQMVLAAAGGGCGDG